MKKFVALASLSLAFSACGDKNGNPLKGYEALDQDIPVGVREVKKQVHPMCGSVVSVEKLVVVEGQTGSSEITVKGPNANRAAAYVLTEKIEGAQLVKGAQKKIAEKSNGIDLSFEQSYKLTYKAARGTVAYGVDKKLISGTIAPSNQVNAAVSCAVPVEIEVHKIEGIPAIKNLQAPKELTFDKISDIEVIVNVEAAKVSKIEDLELSVGFDQSRQSKENPIQNLQSMKLEKSAAIPVSSTAYKFAVKISGEALKAAVEKLSNQNKKKMFFDFHATFTVTNSLTKESSLTHDYILRIDRKPIEAAAAPAPTTGDKK